jgi:hypothetical protein
MQVSSGQAGMGSCKRSRLKGHMDSRGVSSFSGPSPLSSPSYPNLEGKCLVTLPPTTETQKPTPQGIAESGKRVLCCFYFVLRQAVTVQPWLAWNSLCSPGWAQNHSYLPVSAFQVLGSKVSTTKSRNDSVFPLTISIMGDLLEFMFI